MTLSLSISDTTRGCDLRVLIRPLSNLKPLVQTKVALFYPPDVHNLFRGNGCHRFFH
jgi:hypothetical protein